MAVPYRDAAPPPLPGPPHGPPQTHHQHAQHHHYPPLQAQPPPGSTMPGPSSIAPQHQQQQGMPHQQYAPMQGGQDPYLAMQQQQQQQQQQQHYPPPSQQQIPQMPPVAAPGGATAAVPGEAGKQLSQEQKLLQAKNLEPFSKTDEQGRTYLLDVVQQPQRARMCGFGDKDRRPITPPPCVRLIVRDAKTGKEIDCNEIEHTMYILNVDLWSEDALKEVNLVRSTSATPSISSTTPTSYAAVDSMTPFSNILPSSRSPYDMPYQGQPGMPYGMPGQPPYPQQGYMPNGAPTSYGPPQQFYPDQYRQDIASQHQLASQNFGRGGYDPNAQYMQGRMSLSGGQPQGMFTRNLIGSLAASAFRLTDTNDKIGIWFVLQDLSVRTEGFFRLRFSFVNVAAQGLTVANTNMNNQVNTHEAPVLASVFSDVFQVYSAKKFPGVCESTPLSKCFATQGIKIPIRKDNQTRGGGDDNDYDD